MASLKAFNFHSTMKSLEMSPSQTLSSVFEEGKLTTNCEGPDCEGLNCEGPLMAVEGDQFLQLINPAVRGLV